MPNSFDLIVIGTGSAASEIAFSCRAGGRTVAVIDSLPFGGTCALRGCDPKKVLVGAADAVDWVSRMQGKGIQSDTRIAWPELMRFKRSFTEPFPKHREEGYQKEGIVSIHGRAHFLGPNQLSVNGEQFEARHIAIAAGTKPSPLSIPGEELAITSDQFLELEHLPERILFIGGGYIAFEFAHLSARAGAKAIILHRGAQALKGFDPDLVDRLVTQTRAIGIEVFLNTAVTAIEKKGAGFLVHTGSKSYEADLVVHAAGRSPNIDDMNLEAGNVLKGARGIRVNEYLQSESNPNVYAAGDCADTGTPALTPVAGWEGAIAAANILAPSSRKQERQAIPSIVFSIPSIASVGLSEEQARKAGLKFRTVLQDSSNWYSSRRVGEDCSGSKILLEEGTDRILGAHLLGHHAEETINLFTLAIRSKLTARDLKGVLFAYPTYGSDIHYRV